MSGRATAYVLRCVDGSLCVGITRRMIEERPSEHAQGISKGYAIGENIFEARPPKGTRREVFTLDEGDVVITPPDAPESVRLLSKRRFNRSR